ncbi:adenylate cyclase [Verrucomicrobium sp. GAS474]|uniref:CHASE2 domain-containing protein n=1 Tax=Verrucomicrobium sp. GAS474 TaxID=1882831 RepID=UPI00087B434F|nr:CHASE2 domain-containing protein [Verrucomicrobium sp. GAS474]SDT91683.1 adenylate cyclase [Verrucomicrobium sp. GAS474]
MDKTPSAPTDGALRFPALGLTGRLDLKRARIAAGFGLVWAVLVSFFHFGGFFDAAEERLVDWETTWIASAPAQSDKDAYALLSIDRVPSDRPWPWPRLDYAILLRGLLPEHPRSVVFEMLMHDEDPRYTAFDDTFASLIRRCGTGAVVLAAAALQTDAKTPPPENALALSLALPSSSDPKADLKPDAEPNPKANPDKAMPTRYGSLFWPVPTFSEGAFVGVTNLGPDTDGVLRHVPLFFRVRDKILPSLALAAAASRIGADLARSEVRPGHEVILRDGNGKTLRRVPIDASGSLRLRLRSPGLPVLRIGNDDFVLGADQVERGIRPDAVPMASLAGRQVWIAATDPSVAKPLQTPGGLRAPVEVAMAASAQIVRGDFLHPIPKALASLLFLVTGGVLAYAARRFHFGRALLLIGTTLASITLVSLAAVALANVVFPLIALAVLGTGVILSGLAAGAWESEGEIASRQHDPLPQEIDSP